MSIENEKLVNSLLEALRQSDEKGLLVRKLLGELLVSQDGISLLNVLKEEKNPGQPNQLSGGGGKVKSPSGDQWKTGQAVRRMSVNGRVIVVPEANISLIKEIDEKSREKYVKNSRVPLNDFRRFMHGLAGQFNGELSTIKDSKLKKIVLPVMVPHGFGLPDLPDKRADAAVLVHEGHWNGVILCTEVGGTAGEMSEFTPSGNGDEVGTGLLDNGEQVLLINVVSLLKREGFLVMV